MRAMNTRTLYIPERSNNLALKIAYAVQAGTIPCLEQYLDEQRAAASAEVLAKIHGDPDYRVRCVVLEQRTVDDGRITVPRIVDAIGEAAAAILIVVVGPFLVGWSTLL